MPLNQRRAVFKRVQARPSFPAPVTVDLPPLTDEQVNDVRPDKVAKARQLIKASAYPPEKVVRSLADQIARFF
jgi:hypothetical protein